MPYKVDRKNDAIVVTIELEEKRSWEQRFLIISDVHFDNKSCKRQMLKQDLEEAKRLGAGIIDNGDFFDVMGGKMDPRSNKSDILPQYNKEGYFDAVLQDAESFLKPYKDNIVLMSEGNHEISVKNRHEFSLTQGLISRLGFDICHQKYSGWIVFSFKNKKGKPVGRITMYRTHGTGGNAPVTKGAIQSSRRQEMIDADIYISGHIHTEYTMPRPKWYLDKECSIKIRNPLHQQVGTYKDSTLKTWEDMKGFPPPSLGGQWLIFTYCNQVGDAEGRIKKRFESTRS